MIGTPIFVLCRNEATHIYFCQFRGRLRYYIEDKVGVCIIDSIPHCHTKNLSKEAKIKKCGFVSIYREDKIGESIIDSIPHCPIENAF